jgi:uncharacterized membrane protein
MIYKQMKISKKQNVLLTQNNVIMSIRRKDNEFIEVFSMPALFTAVLIAVEIWYSNWTGMFSNLFVGVLVILVHIATISAGFMAVKEWKDPNYDKYRKYLMGFLVALIIIICGFRAFKNEWKMFYDDVEKAKQEQVK